MNVWAQVRDGIPDCGIHRNVGGYLDDLKLNYLIKKFFFFFLSFFFLKLLGKQYTHTHTSIVKWNETIFLQNFEDIALLIFGRPVLIILW